MRKPKIVVIECLYGTKCRYDGQGYNDKVIQSLKKLCRYTNCMSWISYRFTDTKGTYKNRNE